jgi:NitT/TauT family transport system permease protein
MATTTSILPSRADFDAGRVADVPADLDIERVLPLAQRMWALGWVRRLVVLMLIGALWQGYAVYLHNTLLFPSLTETVQALFDGVVEGPLVSRVLVSLKVLLIAYGIGIAIAVLLVSFAVSTSFGQDLLNTLTAMFNPLPAIALLPLAMLWFGLSSASLIFVIVHSVLWAVALNALSGFTAVNQVLRMSGQNYGLKRLRFVRLILIPAALPAIISGLKIAWAFAWRTLIAAELVFGATSRSGGLGWYIYESRNELETPSVFAGLLLVIVIGLFVEGVVFNVIERRTVRRWGMQR